MDIEEPNSAVTGEVAKSVSALIANAVTWAAGNVKATARKNIAKFLNEETAAFQMYLERRHHSVEKTRNVLYSDPVSIHSFYVPISFSTSEDNRVITKTDAEFLAYLDVTKNILIEADAGAGKSIFMRKLFIDTIRKRTNAPRLPVLFDLRVLNESGRKPLEAEIFEDIRSYEPTLMPEQWEIGLRSGLFFILLDGFDEIDPELKSHYHSELLSLSRKFPRCPIAVSTRPDDQISNAALQVVRINPLGKAEVLQLIQRLEFNEEIKAEFLARVELDLFDSHKAFLQRPLLAVMMLITYNEKRAIEFKLTRFYQDAYSALYYLHDVRKGGFRRRYHSKLDRDQMFECLKSFCILSYLENNYRMSEADLQKYAAKALAMNHLRAGTSDLIYDLTSSLSLLQRDGLHFTFIHRSFQEYFAAEYISGCTEARALKIISAIANRVETDSAILMVRDLNEALVDVKWLLPKLRDLQAIGVGECDFKSFINATFVAGFGVATSKMGKPLQLSRRAPFGHAIDVLFRIFNVAFIPALIEKFGILRRSFDGELPDIKKLLLLRPPDFGGLLVVCSTRSESLAIANKVAEILQFVDSAIKIIEERHRHSVEEIDAILDDRVMPGHNS